MSNGIYLTLEQYKDKDLPITITINGHTYHSQFALATAQATYFEMGKQHGMELGSDNTYSDKEMSRMHNAWYDKGKAEGYEEGYNDAKGEDDYCKDCKEEPGRDEDGPEQTEYDKGYAEGKEAGYEEGYERGFMDLRLVLKK